jgi:GNAT superfamily N-acetyltransferase
MQRCKAWLLDVVMAPVEVRPITAARVSDLHAFAGANGKFAYCSCMKWRMRSTEFKNSTKQQRAAALDELVRSGAPVGLLAYDGARPVGWTSLAPRADYPMLARSRSLPQVDGAGVWAVVCFYVVAGMRRRGVQHAMLRAALDEAQARGARALEGYPVPSDAKLYRYMGSRDVFAELGFADVTPPASERVVMRYSF